MKTETRESNKKEAIYPKTTTFLLATASKDLRKSIISALNFIGYSKYFFGRTGTEAWEFLKGIPIDFVIAEWQLPEMDGFVLLKITKSDETFANIPFVLIADELTRQKVIDAGKAGVSAILLKPLTIGLIQEKLEKIYALLEDPSTKQAEKLIEEGKTLKYDDALFNFRISFKKVTTLLESAEIYFNIGYIMLGKGKYDDALFNFRKATQINSAFINAYRMMGQIYQKMGRAKEAGEALEAAAELYMDQDMFDNAEKIYTEIAKINPDSVNVYNTLGILARKKGDSKVAMAYYKKALKVNPQDENVYYNIGRLNLDIKRFDEARKSFMAALNINPDFREARNILRSLDLGLSL
ncbi:MAG: tetratricopeptide repeat protein [Deltaproteobacteria bacterium]|nr:tetratricopeptide repeat protein [Deltaproteobacteria bacterium]